MGSPWALLQYFAKNKNFQKHKYLLPKFVLKENLKMGKLIWKASIVKNLLPKSLKIFKSWLEVGLNIDLFWH